MREGVKNNATCRTNGGAGVRTVTAVSGRLPQVLTYGGRASPLSAMGRP